MIGDKIEELRKSKGMTQEELGEKLATSPSTIGMYEQNRRTPDIYKLTSVAEIFGVSTDYLLGIEERDGMETGGDSLYLAGNLKILREQKGKTQQVLATQLGVSDGAIAMWETGSRTPGIGMIVELARYHGVSLDDLVLKDMRPAIPTYARNLAYLRKKHDMTQQDISELLGYRGKQGYNAIETGKVKPTIDILEKLADFFGVTMDQMVKHDLSQEVIQHAEIK